MYYIKLAVEVQELLVELAMKLGSVVLYNVYQRVRARIYQLKPVPVSYSARPSNYISRRQYLVRKIK